MIAEIFAVEHHKAQGDAVLRPFRQGHNRVVFLAKFIALRLRVPLEGKRCAVFLLELSEFLKYLFAFDPHPFIESRLMFTFRTEVVVAHSPRLGTTSTSGVVIVL